MKADAQKIAIATACGWHGIKQAPEDLYELRFRCFTNDSNGMPPDEITALSWIGRHPSNSADACYCALPDYLNDLNAAHEMEKVLTFENAYRYAERLAEILNRDGVGILDYSDAFAVIHATATQRCEAFLKTLNLWTT